MVVMSLVITQLMDHMVFLVGLHLDIIIMVVVIILIPQDSQEVVEILETGQEQVQFLQIIFTLQMVMRMVTMIFTVVVQEVQVLVLQLVCTLEDYMYHLRTIE